MHTRATTQHHHLGGLAGTETLAATVNCNAVAGNEGGAVAGQEGHQLAHLLGLTNAPA